MKRPVNMVTNLANFRFKKIGDRYLLTLDTGRWIFLTEVEFEKFLTGKLAKKSPILAELKAQGFLRTPKTALADYARQYLKLNASVAQGPALFIFVLTLQCNHRCLYCQVIPEKRGAKGFDMNKATAKKSVELAFCSPSSQIRLEFQGGEPLLNWPVLQEIVRYAKKLNQTVKKDLKISLVTNLTLLDEEKLAFLLKENVELSCSFDGPAEVHNRNRVYLDQKGGSYAPLVKKMQKVQKEIAKHPQYTAGKLGAILTTTKFGLAKSKEIVDEYLAHGFNNIFLKPLSPFGLQRETLALIGYSAEEFIEFYEKTLDYILELNLQGTFFVERTAAIALQKILKQQDAGYTELRSPCGAGIGQIAFDYDGQVFTCDEGRMARRLGHQNFQLGKVQVNTYEELIDNEVNKTMCLASTLDNHAGCNDCVYKPYCGICPLANFVEYGTIFPQILNTDKHKINQALFEYLFAKITKPKYRRIFESWL